jgi:tRNA G18 (ribose-2'-O)-methylase SpoU
VSDGATLRAEIPLRGDGPDSLNVAMAATVALYELGTRKWPIRMAADG